MFKLLYPKLYVAKLFDIDPAELQKKGIRAILLDLDNTIVPRDQDCCPDEIMQWIKKAKKHGFKLCIVSNNSPARVQALASSLAIPAVYRAVKPARRPFIQAMKLLGVTPGQTAVIGDQIFTDVLGGNRLGLYTILVVPLPGREFWATRLFSRRLEKVVLRRLARKMPGGSVAR
ncbi:HAD superfamily phosphatase (TIGR01668 family) [Desulfofundulus luciae]|uniref:HAD superfamily phosphatase (TIGR01668 family) n=1 Tax=Desulfofundulus luciae TaxID=74702 RepID=A0ABU0B1A3_9FIRM|nr:YqeG family HAD IIIA-type phosphatase [Desulfofundulus luciae]MDQ0286513.1 HAD superfamily phosphatase (TIGR01668 family) [Desulfofundulus luciae]